MFEQITSGSRTGARRSSSWVVSIVLHGAIIGFALGFSYYKAHYALKEEEPVEIKLHAPPPPPPPRHKKTPPRETPKHPVTPKVPRTAIIQPKELPKVDEKPPESQDNSLDE